MKRLLTFFLICFSFVEYTRAEDIIDYKYWDEGKLTWDDFQDTLSLKGVPSAFNAFLRIEKQKTRWQYPHDPSRSASLFRQTSFFRRPANTKRELTAIVPAEIRFA